MDDPVNLGRLVKITDLRKAWISEPTDFTPWLAGEDNLSLLADTLGLELELVSQEHGVGPYRADVVCRNLNDGSLVLVENQLEKTDHVHLGQLMTYAAGLDAVTIVWIAKRFTDEHRAALDWINEVTGPRTSFFGLEIELWRIGDSPIAPKFNVVSEPNDWVKTAGGGGGVPASLQGQTETTALQQDFWRAFKEHVKQQGIPLKPQAARPQHWISLAIGRSGFHLSALVNTQTDTVGVELNMDDALAKSHFHQLHRAREECERDLGVSLTWSELPESKKSRIYTERAGTPIGDPAGWPVAHAWLAETLQGFDRVFRPRIKALPAEYTESP